MIRVADLSCTTITHRPDNGMEKYPWHLWLPPTGPECYEGGDVENGALLDSWGDTYWPTVESAARCAIEVLGLPIDDRNPSRDYEHDDGTLHIQLTDEGVIVDLYDSHGNVLDTWARASGEFFEGR